MSTELFAIMASAGMKSKSFKERVLWRSYAIRIAQSNRDFFRMFGTYSIAAARGLAADDRRRFQAELNRRLGLPPVLR